jgi:hypothetical protein
MARFTHDRIRGSLWSNGILGALVGGVIVVGLLIAVPAIRWFLAVAVVIGLAISGLLRWYYAHVPVKLDTDDQIVLHLNDDVPLNQPNRDQSQSQR